MQKGQMTSLIGQNTWYDVFLWLQSMSALVFEHVFRDIETQRSSFKLDQKNRLTIAGDFNLTLTQITFKTFSGGCRWIPISLDKQVTLWPPFDFSKFFWQSFSCQGGSFLPCRCSTQMPLLMEGANRLFTKSFVICLITNLGTRVRKTHFRKIPIIKVFCLSLRSLQEP